MSDEDDPTNGLPPDLAVLLRDHSIVIDKDGSVFALLAKWANAPSNTASADLNGSGYIEQKERVEDT